MTSNFICLTFSTWRSSTSSLWRIVTQIFLWLEKDSITPGNHKSVLREKPCSRWCFSLYLIPYSLLSPPPPPLHQKCLKKWIYGIRISRAFFQNKKLRAQFPIHRKGAGTEQERQLDRRGRSHHFKKLFVTTEMSWKPIKKCLQD